MSELPNRNSKRTLSALDAACIIVGIIIGAGIYKTTPTVASQMVDSYWLIGVWVLGGILALVGALCYAELATSI
ncbi:MAG TPA: amino acid permease, partial [Planctomycetaceae bacterium]|nr:amino acid permease [Planctomycetaceae bacterium]